MLHKQLLLNVLSRLPSDVYRRALAFRGDDGGKKNKSGEFQDRDLLPDSACWDLYWRVAFRHLVACAHRHWQEEEKESNNTTHHPFSGGSVRRRWDSSPFIQQLWAVFSTAFKRGSSSTTSLTDNTAHKRSHWERVQQHMYASLTEPERDFYLHFEYMVPPIASSYLSVPPIASSDLSVPPIASSDLSVPAKKQQWHHSFLSMPRDNKEEEGFYFYDDDDYDDGYDDDDGYYSDGESSLHESSATATVGCGKEIVHMHAPNFSFLHRWCLEHTKALNKPECAMRRRDLYTWLGMYGRILCASGNHARGACERCHLEMPVIYMQSETVCEVCHDIDKGLTRANNKP